MSVEPNKPTVSAMVAETGCLLNDASRLIESIQSRLAGKHELIDNSLEKWLVDLKAVANGIGGLPDDSAEALSEDDVLDFVAGLNQGIVDRAHASAENWRRFDPERALAKLKEHLDKPRPARMDTAWVRLQDPFLLLGIADMRNAGYTMREIADLLTEGGLEIEGNTLRVYLSRVRKKLAAEQAIRGETYYAQ